LALPHCPAGGRGISRFCTTFSPTPPARCHLSVRVVYKDHLPTPHCLQATPDYEPGCEHLLAPRALPPHTPADRTPGAGHCRARLQCPQQPATHAHKSHTRPSTRVLLAALPPAAPIGCSVPHAIPLPFFPPPNSHARTLGPCCASDSERARGLAARSGTRRLRPPRRRPALPGGDVRGKTRGRMTSQLPGAVW